MIRLLDLPGAQQLEARLELCPGLSASSCPRTRDLLAHIVDALGFDLDFTGWIVIPDGPENEAPIDYDAYEEALWSDDLVDFWQRKGWDIAGAGGKPVRFFDVVSRALIIITEGSAGSSMMKLEASLWKRERNDNAPVDPTTRHRDQAFLRLGGQRRRG